MSLPHRELVELIDEAATRLEPTEYGPWLGQQTVTVAGDPTVPNAPTITASPADQAIDLAITPPSTNTNGSQYLDHKEFEIFYSTSPGIDVDNPTTYAGSFTTSSTQHTFPASITYYFRAVAWDKYGNRSDPSNEVSATPISSGYEPDIDDYTNNIANVYVGIGIIGIEFQPPKSTWVRWAGWKLYYDVDDGTGWTGTWTLIYTGPGPGFLHKGLNESYAYKYKLTVLGEDGTETTGTVSDNAGAGYTPNASDNSAILGSTIFAERMVATKEMISRTFIGGVLQSTNWSTTAGSQLDLDNGTLKLGGSSSPKFQVDADGVLYATGAVISGALTAGPGSSIDGVYIEDATITSAKISDLTFDKITAGTNTASLTIGSGGYIQSENYSAGSAGFKISGSGDAEFNDVTVRGALITGSGSQVNADYITTGTITGRTIQTSSDYPKVIMGPTVGGYSHAIAVYNSSGDVETVIWEGQIGLWNNSGTQTFQLYGDNGSGTAKMEFLTSSSEIYFRNGGKIYGTSSNPVELQYTSGRFTYCGQTVFSDACPSTWTDLDLSSYVGSRRALVFLKVKNAAGSAKKYRFRPNGDTGDYSYGYDRSHCSACTIDPGEYGTVWVMTDASGIIEWMSGVSESTSLVLLAYIT